MARFLRAVQPELEVRYWTGSVWRVNLVIAVQYVWSGFADMCATCARPDQQRYGGDKERRIGAEDPARKA